MARRFCFPARRVRHLSSDHRCRLPATPTIPFTIDEKTALAAFTTWSEDQTDVGDLEADEKWQVLRPVSLQPRFIPFYFFEGDAETSFRAFIYYESVAIMRTVFLAPFRALADHMRDNRTYGRGKIGLRELDRRMRRRQIPPQFRQRALRKLEKEGAPKVAGHWETRSRVITRLVEYTARLTLPPERIGVHHDAAEGVYAGFEWRREYVEDLLSGDDAPDVGDLLDYDTKPLRDLEPRSLERPRGTVIEPFVCNPGWAYGHFIRSTISNSKVIRAQALEQARSSDEIFQVSNGNGNWFKWSGLPPPPDAPTGQIHRFVAGLRAAAQAIEGLGGLIPMTMRAPQTILFSTGLNMISRTIGKLLRIPQYWVHANMRNFYALRRPRVPGQKPDKDSIDMPWNYFVFADEFRSRMKNPRLAGAVLMPVWVVEYVEEWDQAGVEVDYQAQIETVPPRVTPADLEKKTFRVFLSGCGEQRGDDDDEYEDEEPDWFDRALDRWLGEDVEPDEYHLAMAKGRPPPGHPSHSALIGGGVATLGFAAWGAAGWLFGFLPVGAIVPGGPSVVVATGLGSPVVGAGLGYAYCKYCNWLLDQDWDAAGKRRLVERSQNLYWQQDEYWENELSRVMDGASPDFSLDEDAILEEFTEDERRENEGDALLYLGSKVTLTHTSIYGGGGGGGSQRVRLRQSGQLRRTPRRDVVAGFDDAMAWPLRQST
eukprot:g5275.t1